MILAKVLKSSGQKAEKVFMNIYHLITALMFFTLACSKTEPVAPPSSISKTDSSDISEEPLDQEIVDPLAGEPKNDTKNQTPQADNPDYCPVVDCAAPTQNGLCDHIYPNDRLSTGCLQFPCGISRCSAATSNSTRCTTNSQCWCSGFTGSVNTNVKSTGTCNATTGTCNPCIYY